MSETANTDITQLQQIHSAIQVQEQELKAVVAEFKALKESCRISEQEVKATADEQVAKIREHEKRLLEEIQTQCETEYKKLSVSQETLEAVSEGLEELSGKTQTVLESPTPEAIHHMQLHLTRALGKVDQAVEAWFPDDNTASIHQICFNPIRCNTAFGIIQPVAPSGDQWNTPQRRCLSMMMRPIAGETSPHASGHKWQRTCSLHVARSTNSYLGPPTKDGAPKWGLRRHHSMKATNDIRSMDTFSWSPMVLRRQSQRERKTDSDPAVSSATLLWEISKEGHNLGEINCPTDISFLPDGCIAITDRDNERLQILDSKGKGLKVIAQGKIKPKRLAITADGNLAVTDIKDCCIKVFNTNGQCLSTWGKKRFKAVFKSPCGIGTLSTGKFIVSDMERHTVGLYNPDGKLIRQLGGSVSEHSNFHSPAYIATDTNDSIYVADNWNHSVKVYDSAGEFEFQFNKLGGDTEYLEYPNGICLDEQGNIHVADWGKHTVSVFNSKGRFVRQVLSRTDGLFYPAGIAIRGKYLAVTEYSDSHSAVRLFQL